MSVNRRIKKVWLGAGASLIATVVAIGCGTKKTTTTVTQSGELGGPNSLPASAIATNNLGDDRGGFSNNNQTASIGNVRAVFNNPRVESLSPHGSADNSAMVFFVTSDDTSTADHAYASYFSNGAFTPPVEITGLNRNEAIGATQGTTQAYQSIHAASVVLIPFNTSSFVDPNGNANALVRNNQGNWAILWDAETVSTNPNPSITGKGAAIAGAHHTVYLNMFLKSFAGTPATTTNRIGNTSTTSTLNGSAAVELHYGFQVSGVEITPFVGGQVLGETVSLATAGFFTGNNTSNATVFQPAEDIVSYGAATDTFVHAASFNTSGGTNVAGLNVSYTAGPFGNYTFELGPSNPATSTPTIAVPGAASYEVGDDTSFIQIFWVQLVASGDAGQSSTFFPSPNTTASIQLGDNYQLLTANLNLATMTISGSTPNNDPLVAAGQAQVPYTATMNAGDARSQTAAQAEANFVTYNNLVFWNFIDTSLQDDASSPSSPGTDLAQVQQLSQVLSVVAVLPEAGGSAEISTGANQTDITVLGNGTRHSIKTVTSTSDPGSESVAFGLCESNIGNPYHLATGNFLGNPIGSPIIGPDEGQGDVTAFVIGQVSTNLPSGTTATASASTKGSNQSELWAAALVAAGPGAGTPDGANTPRIVSVHQADLSLSSANANQNAGTSGSNVTAALFDSVGDVKLALSRDGTYAILGWRQALGTSENSTLALNAAAYQVAVVSSTTSTSAPTLPTLDERLSAVIQVNAGSAAAPGIAYTNQPIPTGLQGIAAGSPVVAWDFQDHVEHRVGFQGVANQMVALYLYNDGTEDRLWVNTLVVTLGATTGAAPTLKTENELELDAAPMVPGNTVFNNQTTPVASTFRFLTGSHGFSPAQYNSTQAQMAWLIGCTSLIPGDANNDSGYGSYDTVDSVDAGSVAHPSTGDVLIVFSKVVDATTTDGNFYDRQILATLYSPASTAALTDVVLSTAALENAQPQSGSTPPAVNFGLGGFRRQLVSNFALVPNARSTSVSPGVGYSPSNGTYVYFTDLEEPNSGSNAAGLFTRHFLARTALGSGAAAPTLAQDVVPTAGTSTSASAFEGPLQIDTLVDESVSNVSNGVVSQNVFVFTAGTEAMVTFVQDNHWWATITQNGGTYSNTGGLSAPILIDNNFSANAGVKNVIATGEVVNESSTGDDLHGTILGVVKYDVDLNPRLYIRVLQ
jgi:hypothetical protein